MKILQWEPNCSTCMEGWADGRIDMTKLIVAFRNFANAPIIPKFLPVQLTQICKRALLLENSQASPVCPSGKSNILMTTSIEWYRQGKIEALRDKPVLLLLPSPQISFWLTLDRFRASLVTGRRLTTCTMACPHFNPGYIKRFSSYRAENTRLHVDWYVLKM